MLLNTVATIILSALMLVPLINIIVGAIVGSGLVGPLGGVGGTLLALLIMVVEKLIGDQRGWFRMTNAGIAAAPMRFQHSIKDGLPAGGALAVTEGDVWEETDLGGEFEDLRAQLIDDEVLDSQWAQLAFSSGFNHAEQLAVNCT